MMAVETVNTSQQRLPDTNSQSESSEDSTSGDDELGNLKQQIAMKDYQEKVLKEQLALRRENWQKLNFVTGMGHKLDKGKNENLK
jgi:hypothetical protein